MFVIRCRLPDMNLPKPFYMLRYYMNASPLTAPTDKIHGTKAHNRTILTPHTSQDVSHHTRQSHSPPWHIQVASAVLL